jgi:putative addiction module component (TIGR02574 family)
MIKTEELFDQAISLPIETRMLLVDKLLQSLNPTQAEVDKVWANEAEDRIEAFDRGEMAAIPVEDVFAEIKKTT